MKEIKLTQGLTTMVDDEDFDYLNQFNWCAIKYKHTFYAIRNSPRVNGKSKSIRMHREILKTPANMITDHIDLNGLNNQRYNLRVVTKQQNAFNTKAKGYSFNKNAGKWSASIKVNGKKKHLGYFETKKKARKAYIKAKETYHIIREKATRLKQKITL